MKYEILKDFAGSQDGRFTEQFKAGTTVDLSDYLAGIVVQEGWAKLARPAQAELDIANKAIVMDGSQKRGKHK